MQNESDRPWSNPNGSHFWKDIMHVSPAVDSSLSYQLGNGSIFKFWHDNWKGTPLKYGFPNLYQATGDKQCSVQQRRLNDTWHFDTQPLNLMAQMEQDQLSLLLQDVQIQQQPDSITWFRNSNTFSVSSLYKFLAQTPSPTSIIAKLWQIKAPLRISVFAWLLLNNRLTTIENLVHRGWHLPSICVMCRRAEETTRHLFQTYPVAAEIRLYIWTTFAAPSSISPKYVTPMSTALLVDPNEQMTARQLELVTGFVL